MVKFIDHVEEEEFSDDDEDMSSSTSLSPLPDLPSSSLFSKQDREINQEIYKLARFMILQSQKVETPIFHPGIDTDLSTIMEIHQSTLTLKDMMGNTPLHVLCRNSADTKMMKIIFECCPAEKIAFTQSATSFELVRIQNSHGCNPLHFLAGDACPFSSVKFILQFCYPQESTGGPDARLLQDYDGDLPLHWAFSRGVSPRRLTALLSDCHDSLLCANNENILPMQSYVDDHCENFDFMDPDQKQALWDMIQGILKVATKYHKDDGWSPLHAIASGVAFLPQTFWTIGLEFERDNLCTYNDDGMLPLHVAVSTAPVNGESSRYVSGVKQYAILMEEIMLSSFEAPRMPTSAGRLALHLAVESKHDQYVIDTLRRLNPNALSTIDPITLMPPFMLAAVDENNSLDLVYSLLREEPSIVQTMTR
jgi:ankyrin repeat protein